MRTRVSFRTAALVSVTVAAAFLSAGAFMPPDVTDHSHHRHGMDPEVMRRSVAAWYSSHPAHGGSDLLGAGADTFLVRNFVFDTDGNLATAEDTARVEVGESVLFKWVEGFHTTTSGTPGGPDEGLLWDHPIDNLAPENREFAVTFQSPGTIPFFCQPHAGFGMTGVVVVSGTVGVPIADLAGSGFTRSPAPNPTRAGVHFQFAIAKPGRVRIDVFDTSGRRVARVLDRDLEAGTHSSSWNGRPSEGRAVPGVYYLRLTAPELDQTRRVSIER